jgi:hypothetical protein
MNRDTLTKAGKFALKVYTCHLLVFAIGVALGTIQCFAIMTALYEAGVLKP